MSSRVGAKGNIVVDKEIRDRLGVQPGWETVQLLRDGHVEIHFLPPARPGASAGSLSPHIQQGLFTTDEELRQAILDASADAAIERYDRSLTADGDEGTAGEEKAA